MKEQSVCGIRDYRDRFRMKADDDFTDWDVTHYGAIVEDHDTVIGGLCG